ncbi:hypothetical protein [Bacillus mojavensis]|uniref:hypothetical protein n=1 Tax=Bacillus mojavensis TaxID=72360 RepID=UPI002DB595BF|nr:hypothetical protein [Bacillus mojavensis]MEC1672385.1 hypothetical protein [Bacillus mojavensis]MEC1681486.1 hypothetical protein [Bacillus mojavensis]MEC1711588.1 hypothetical protein [Bacillus mojavensis]
MSYTLLEAIKQCQMIEDEVRYDEKIGLLLPDKRKAKGIGGLVRTIRNDCC